MKVFLLMVIDPRFFRVLQAWGRRMGVGKGQKRRTVGSELRAFPGR